uniref:Putative VP1 protein n=1 Tax=Tarsiger cyanurus ambidensovirus TaxID=2794449 RepID=A0A8E7G2H8_9VIRU|nr:MAG: putative VP1 protein [Tarsiger cyanurus ambidensovirus]
MNPSNRPNPKSHQPHRDQRRKDYLDKVSQERWNAYSQQRGLTSAEAPPVQNTAVSSSSGAEGTGMEINPQAGSSLPGGTGADVVATIIKNPQADTVCLRFSKNFQVYTGGYLFTKQGSTGFAPGVLNSATFNQDLYTSPLAAITPGCAALYMSRAEWNQLPPLSYATKSRIKVTPLGYRLPFATNEATSQYANSQTLVQIMAATGLNTKMNLITGSYTAAPTDLTIPTGIIDTFDPAEILYGDGISTLGAVMGIPRHWNYYTTMLVPANSGNPMLLSHAAVQNVNDCKGTPIINYEYDFKCGVIKPAAGDFWNSLSGGNLNLNEGLNKTGFSGRTASAAAGINNTLSEQIRSAFSLQPGAAINLPTMAYQTDIEKSDILARQWGEVQVPDRPPLVHFGVMPVQSNAALAAAPTFADVVVQWEIECEIEVCYHYNYITAHSGIFNLKSWDPQVGATDLTSAFYGNMSSMAYIQNRRAHGIDSTSNGAIIAPTPAPPTPSRFQ